MPGAFGEEVEKAAATAAAIAKPVPGVNTSPAQPDDEIVQKARAYYARKTKSRAEKGLLYLQQYRPDQAIRTYIPALIALSKKDLSKQENAVRLAALLTTIGRAFKSDENDRAACTFYEMARKYDPDAVVNKAYLLESLVQTAQLARADKLAEELLKLKKDNGSVLRALAVRDNLLENYDGCVKYLERALALEDDPLKHVTARVLAQARIRRGIQAGVPELFEQSASTTDNPYDSEIHFGMSDVAANKPTQALDHFSRAGKILPDDPAWLNGKTQVSSTLPGGADEAFNDAILAVSKGRFTTRSMIVLSNALNARGQKADADKCLDRLEKIKPWSWQPPFYKARMQRTRGDYDAARANLVRAAKINPRSSSIFQETVQTYQLEGKNKEALDLLKKYIANYPRTISLWTKRGTLAILLKDFDDAYMSFSQALKLLPPVSQLNIVLQNETAITHAGLGTVAYHRNKREEAIAEAKLFNQYKFVPKLPGYLSLIVIRPAHLKFEATSKKERQATELVALADMLFEMRQLQPAVDEYKKAVELNNNDVDTHSFYLNALVDNNNWVEAAKEEIELSSKMVGRAAETAARFTKPKNKTEVKPKLEDQSKIDTLPKKNADPVIFSKTDGKPD